MKWKPAGEKMFSRKELVLAQITRREINNRLISCPPPPIKRKKSSSFPEEKKTEFRIWGGEKKRKFAGQLTLFFVFIRFRVCAGNGKDHPRNKL